MRKKIHSKKEITQLHKRLIYFIIIVGILFIGVRIVKAALNSLLFARPDRVNVVLYDVNNPDDSIYLSLGLTDPVYYMAHFPVHLNALVPGGYGKYELQSVGKLSQIEKKPSIVQKTYSSLSSSYVDYYFIYNTHHTGNKISIRDIFLPPVSNTNFFDRIALYVLLNKRSGDYSVLDTNLSNNDYETSFFKEYAGYFYKKGIRSEDKTISLIYNSNSSVKTLSRILEGEGIHIVDLTYEDTLSNNCVLTKNSPLKTETERYFVQRFHCEIKIGDTGGQDMVIELGNNLEKEWE